MTTRRNLHREDYRITVRPLSKEEGGGYLGAVAQRLPRTLYLKLTERASSEGVSINSLVTAMIAEAIGSRSNAKARR